MKYVAITFCVAGVLGYTFHDKAKAFVAKKYDQLKMKLYTWTSKL